VRRYVRANRLKRLWTLTYRGAPASRAAVVADLRRFYRRIGKVIGRVPLLTVIERGELGGRQHVHFATDRFLPIRKLYACWPHGYVHIGDPGQLAGRVGVRKLAAYLAKYVAKQIDDDENEGEQGRAKREHRYLVTQGFTPTAYSLRYGRIGQAVERMHGVYGKPDVSVPFGDWETGLVYGIWYAFPDHILHPSPLQQRRDSP
jgi:hypothetical protein